MRGIAHWNEDDYINQIQSLLVFSNYSLDFNYIESQLQTKSEKKVYQSIKDYFIDKISPSLIHEKIEELFIDFKIGDIDYHQSLQYPTLELSSCLLIKPSNFSMYKDKSYLRGYLGKLILEFLVDEKSYYNSISDTGFNLKNIYRVDGVITDYQSLQEIISDYTKNF